MSDTQKPAYTRTNVQRFVNLLAADDNISRHAYALLESAGEISYDEVAAYRAEAHATSVELENAKKHLELAENALQREQGLLATQKGFAKHYASRCSQLKKSIAAITAENDFLKEKVCELGGTVEGFTPTPKVTYTFATQGVPGPGTWTVKPLPEEPKPAIKPGDGYRLLKVGERLMPGDDATHDGKKWFMPPYDMCVIHEQDPLTYRRKIEPAAKAPKNPFASYVAPKKEQKYRELGEKDILQPGDFWVLKSRYNNEASRYEMTEEDATRRYPIDVRVYGYSAKLEYGYAYIRPITEKDAE